MSFLVTIRLKYIKVFENHIIYRYIYLLYYKVLQFAKVSKCFHPTKGKEKKMQKKRNIINNLTLFVYPPIRCVLFFYVMKEKKNLNVFNGNRDIFLYLRS